MLIRVFSSGLVCGAMCYSSSVAEQSFNGSDAALWLALMPQNGSDIRAKGTAG